MKLKSLSAGCSRVELDAVHRYEAVLAGSQVEGVGRRTLSGFLTLTLTPVVKRD